MTDYLNLLSQISPRRILVVGDLMCDEYVKVDPVRISPEAPIPILKYLSQIFTPGGTANVAKNLAVLGNSITLLGLVGMDQQGQTIIDQLSKLGVNCRNVLFDSERRTTTKTRFISQQQQIIRVDREDVAFISEEQEAACLDFIRETIDDYDGVIISDYNKGVMTPGLTKNLIEIANRHGIFSIADPKGNNFNKYKNITVLTPNRKEAEIIVGYPFCSRETIGTALRQLKDMLNANILITLGEQGVALISRDEEIHFFSVQPREVFDVTGAGDTIVTFLTIFCLNSIELKIASYLANISASISVTKFGTTPVTLRELESEVEQDKLLAHKLKTQSELLEILHSSPFGEKQIVFCYGYFDTLHFGHIDFFKQAKREKEILVVAVYSDKVIQSIEPERQPYIRERQRIFLLASIEYIDFIILLDETYPQSLLDELTPATLIKCTENDYYPGQAKMDDQVIISERPVLPRRKDKKDKPCR